MPYRYWLFVCVLIVDAVAQTPKRPTPKPNVVLITIDTTRADRMGFLGSDRGLTPSLDAVAKEGFAFTRAYSQVPLTTPSHAAILTGTYPQFNHVNDFGAPIGADLPYLPDILHAHGYRTAAFVGSIALDPVNGTAPGFDRGFDVYDADFHGMGPNETRYESVERRGEYVVANALKWLNRKRGGAPFFIWVHLYDPHDPYEPPEPYKSKFSDPYDGEVAYSDAMLGRLFAGLRSAGLYNGSLIAVMSDHGEAFGEHGERTHGVFLYDETIHVPLLIKLPAVAVPSGGTTGKAANKIRNENPGRKIDDRVSLVDVTPTILESLHISIPKTIQGRSLVSLLTHESSGAHDGERSIYSETDYPFLKFHWSSLRSLRTSKYLYVESSKRELYDESSDPRAAKNLAASSSAIADTLNAQTEALRKSTSSESGDSSAQTDPQQAAKLNALGYVATDNHAKTAPGIGGIDPKDHIESANLFHDGLIDFEEKRYDKAISELERVVEKEPTSGLAFSQLATVWIRLKNFQKALPVLQKAVELRPDVGMNQYELGQALLQTGSLQESVAHFEKAVELTPSADFHFALATIYIRLGRDEEALQQINQALEVDPNHYRSNLLRGIVLAEDKPSEALPNLQKAAELKPDASEPHSYMAKAYEHLGNAAKAAEERQRAKDLSGHP